MSAQTETSAVPQEPAGLANVVRLLEAEQSFMGREVFYRDLLNALPTAIYTTDAQGKITFYNEAAVDFAGRRPALGEEWCVTWRLYNLDGSPLPHAECPMAVALHDAKPIRGREAIAERPDGTRITFAPYPTPLFDTEGRLVGAVNMLVDITERKAAEDRQRLLANEVNHRRANNLLTVVQSVVRLSRAETVEEFRDTLSGRIQALARAHSLLARNRWLGADLQHLVSEELAPFMDERSQVWISGTMLPMAPAAAQSMAMIVHELATNAAKHGSLSSELGKVMIAWRRAPGDRIVFRWSERDGPPAAAPVQPGVGATVIARAASHLKAKVETTWTAEGLTFELDLPAAAISPAVDH